MPRRTADESRSAATKDQEIRWRYLLRNPEFQKDIRELQQLYHEGSQNLKDARKRVQVVTEKRSRDSYSYKRRKLLERWELQFIPLPYSIHHRVSSLLPDLRPGTVADWELLFDPENFPPTGHPIEVFDPGELEPEDRHIPDLPVGRFLGITVDLTYPRDVLMALVEEELRKAQEQRLEPQRRRRLDKVDFQLEVFDRAVQGEFFKVIAKSQPIKRYTSTVKSALMAALRNIFADTEAPSKKGLPSHYEFDTNTHYKQCEVCKSAKFADEMCPLIKNLLDSVTRGQRELPGNDTTR